MPLTASQIDKLTATLTGEKPKRAANRDRALARFAGALSARIGERGAPQAAGRIAEHDGFELAEGDLQAELDAFDAEKEASQEPTTATESTESTDAEKPASKKATLIAMISRDGGATIAEIAEVTGWQNHTIRAAISREVPKVTGLAATSEKVEGRGRAYRVSE